MDLYEAFALSPGAIVAAVGGGGKTSLVYSLGAEAAVRGLSAVVASTTKFTRPPGGEMPRIIESRDADLAARLRCELAPGAVVAASAGDGAHGRIDGFLPQTIDDLAGIGAGLIAVEADGSAHRPFKAPASHEPVIPASATDVIVCAGLEVLGHALEAPWVHRPEIAARLADTFPGALVTADTIVRVLLHEAGGRKGVPAGARLHALLNGPSSEEHERLGAHIAGRLVYGGYHSAVVATAHRPGDIRAVVR